jgi:dipeptidyl aminopeptidase/acylaminoacyl peptidase
MKPKPLTITILLIMTIVLAACSSSQSTPTPTIVPLSQADGEAVSQPASGVKVLSTATPIPPPSTTPTLTPFPLPETATPEPTATPLRPRAQVIIAGLNVRQGPGSNYPVIDTVSTGDELKVTGISPAGDWLQVVIDEVNPGWVAGSPDYVHLLAVTRDELPIVEPPLPPAPVAAPVTTAASTGRTAAGLTGRLVFMTGSGGELVVINVDGSGLRRLASGVIDPVVSPDGRQVAFVRWDGAKIGTLYTINLDGSGERAILGDIARPKSPTWSPDGQQIVISFQHGGLVNPPEVCKEFDADDGFRLPTDIGEITKFRIGPTGGEVCYIRLEDLKWDLRRIEVATGEFEDLPADDYSFNPAWDPSNPWRVIYDGAKGLVQLDLTQATRWAITEDLRDTGPVFSPDGRSLALTYKQHDHWETYTLDLETGTRRRLTKPPILADPQYNSAAPAWSPDGTYLVFVTDRTGQWEIWVMNADGSNQHPLFSPEVQAQFSLDYRGVNERMLNWIE